MDSSKKGGVSRSILPAFKKSYSIIILLGAWQIASYLVAESLFLPSPYMVLQRIYGLLVSGDLLGHVRVSMYRALTGFFLAAVVGIPLGLVMGWYRAWENFWNFLVSLSYPIPKVGFIPLFILWLGIGDLSKVAVIFTAAVYPLVINTFSGVKGVPNIYIWSSLTMGATKRELLLTIVLPSTLPHIFTGLRLAMGISWILLFAAEMVAANTGLGFLILHAQQLFNTDVVFASLVTIGALGFIFDRIIWLIARKTCAWYFQEIQTT